MTSAEMAIATAYSPHHVTYLPGSPDKRFAYDIAALARSDDPQITEGQADYLLRLAKRYRRQVPESILTIVAELERDRVTDAQAE